MTDGGARPEMDTPVDMRELGETCDDDLQCSAGVCGRGWSDEEAERVCCVSQCADDERCGSTGVCQTCEPGRTEPCWATEAGEPLSGKASGLMGDCRLGERSCGARRQLVPVRRCSWTVG